MSRMTKYRASKNSSVTDWLTRKSKTRNAERIITRRWHSSTNWLWRSSGASTKIELSEPEKEEIIPN